MALRKPQALDLSGTYSAPKHARHCVLRAQTRDGPSSSPTYKPPKLSGHNKLTFDKLSFDTELLRLHKTHGTLSPTLSRSLYLSKQHLLWQGTHKELTENKGVLIQPTQNHLPFRRVQSKSKTQHENFFSVFQADSLEISAS